MLRKVSIQSMMVFSSQNITTHPPATAPEALDYSYEDWFLQGESFAAGQDYLKALRCFEEAAILCPKDLESLVYQSVCWIHLNQPEKALALAEGVLAENQGHSQGWLFRGVALHRMGRYREAYASYSQALGTPPRISLLARVKQLWHRS